MIQTGDLPKVMHRIGEFIDRQTIYLYLGIKGLIESYS